MKNYNHSELIGYSEIIHLLYNHIQRIFLAHKQDANEILDRVLLLQEKLGLTDESIYLKSLQPETHNITKLITGVDGKAYSYKITREFRNNNWVTTDVTVIEK